MDCLTAAFAHFCSNFPWQLHVLLSWLNLAIAAVREGGREGGSRQGNSVAVN